eukprot:jgi/Mesvir1/26161/Mv06860-RA.1
MYALELASTVDFTHPTVLDRLKCIALATLLQQPFDALQQQQIADENRTAKRIGGGEKSLSQASRIPILGQAAGGDGVAAARRTVLGNISNTSALQGKAPAGKDGVTGLLKGYQASRANVKEDPAARQTRRARPLSASAVAATEEPLPQTAPASLPEGTDEAALPLPQCWGATKPRTLGQRQPHRSSTSTGGQDLDMQPATDGQGKASGSSIGGGAVVQEGPARGLDVLLPGGSHNSARGQSAIERARARVFQGERTYTGYMCGLSESAIGSTSSDAPVLQEFDDVSLDSLPDVDADDKDNECACPEYVNDILAYYRKVETESVVSPNYMEMQTDINDKMRAILLDWLVEVHLKFKLMPETLYLTQNVIDRYLSQKPVTRRNLQLVGVTAMLVAAKYEEIWAPEVRDFVYISDRAYQRDQIINMERSMLNALKFHLTVATPYPFILRFCKVATAERVVEVIASFLSELAIIDYGMIKYTPSMIAAAAVYVALLMQGREKPWNRLMVRHTAYTEHQLASCAQALVHLHHQAPTNKLVAVHKKYSSERFMEVALLKPLTAAIGGQQSSPMDAEATSAYKP